MSLIQLSAGMQIAWEIAAIEAAINHNQAIETDHFTIGLLSFQKIPHEQPDNQLYGAFCEEKEKFYSILDSNEIDSVAVRRKIRNLAIPGSSTYEDGIIHRSSNCKAFLSQVEKLSGAPVTSYSYFLALLNHPETSLHRILKESGLDIELIKQDLINQHIKVSKQKKEPAIQSRYNQLNRFGRNMVDQAGNTGLPEVFERSAEIRQIITTLGKKTKNNVILIGEPGVGKTAIVEGLARMMADNKVLPGKVIFQIPVSSLVSGTKYRGDFEERLKDLIDEASRCPEVILFFDELHQLIGAGGPEGGLDAANILKPALSRGSFSCIGATTISEYRKYLEKDAAFTRRFQSIMVTEPSVEQSVRILMGLKPGLEKHHQVVITDEAVQLAVEYSVRYETDRFLPDKAIDLVDEACSAVLNKAITINQFGKNLQTGNQAILVNGSHIARVVSMHTGIPISQITDKEAVKLANLESELKKRVIGQDEAITELCNVIRVFKAGIGLQDRPVGVFLFLGSTGVGKSLLAKALAAALFKSDSALIRFDMSEFMEQHTVSKLIGSPPGYVFSEEEGALTKRLRDKPYSVVLFDEVDKAHTKILDILLQLFDEGRISDNRGRLVDGRNAIFIMTANFAQTSRRQIGFSPADRVNNENRAITELTGQFRQEFINRINKIIIFNSLASSDVESIIENSIRDFKETLLNKLNLTMRIEGNLNSRIAAFCDYEKFGARAVSREFERNLREPVSQCILDYEAEGKSIAGKTIRINAEELKITISIV